MTKLKTFIMPYRVEDFLKQESTPGIIVLLAALLALWVNNSAFSYVYQDVLQTIVSLEIGSFAITKPLLLWINDGLMALFFFLVGLEIKREILEGELSSFSQASLPFIAAIGGMAFPAFIYLILTSDYPEIRHGWAIPSATDIAFALGILALLGSRVPTSLKIFLLSIAIIDDIGAISIIALFYTDALSPLALLGALTGLAALAALTYSGVYRVWLYVVLGITVWVFCLKSGVHATLAGVLVAMTIPIKSQKDDQASMLYRFEHALHPWSAFFIIPIFAFANAGVSFVGFGLSSLIDPLSLSIALGLFFGNQIGIFGLSWIAVKSGFCTLPRGVTWVHVHGVACLAGIGFTMSLFIGTLAFDTEALLNKVRIGVLVGSLVSGAVGFMILKVSLKSKRSLSTGHRGNSALPTPHRRNQMA